MKNEFNETILKKEVVDNTPNQLAEQNKELLEALKDIKAAMIFGNNPNDKGLIEIAEAAIANAEK